MQPKGPFSYYFLEIGKLPPGMGPNCTCKVNFHDTRKVKGENSEKGEKGEKDDKGLEGMKRVKRVKR